MSFLNADGSIVRSMDGPNHAGLNRTSWNLTEEPPIKWHKAKEWNQGPDDGAGIVPGTYTVRLQVAGAMQTQPVTVAADPRAPWTQADYVARYQFLHVLIDELSAIDEVLNRLDAKANHGGLSSHDRELYAKLTSGPLNSEDDQHRPDMLRERIQILLDDPSLSKGPPTPAQLQEAADAKAQFDSLMSEVRSSTTR
ncbi:MAG: hypothetical protein JO347_11400 [Candidatus Eremiobacteraeota bacterium]|nr:hypothetical protein [Candidatus Eremiobacteraeota bacterium]